MPVRNRVAAPIIQRVNSAELLQAQQKLLLENPAPYVSAQNWVIIDRKKGDLMFGKCETVPKQVASLTKIMTSLVVLNLIEQYEHSSPFASLNALIKINRPCSKMQGTTANLIENDVLTVEQLFYGMMLPSGNDAAQALGNHFGSLIRTNGTKNPEIVITKEAIERRLKAVKIYKAI